MKKKRKAYAFGSGDVTKSRGDGRRTAVFTLPIMPARDIPRVTRTPASPPGSFKAGKDEPDRWLPLVTMATRHLASGKGLLMDTLRVPLSGDDDADLHDNDDYEDECDIYMTNRVRATDQAAYIE